MSNDKLSKFVAQAMDGQICPKCQSEKPLNRTFCLNCMTKIISAGEARTEQMKRAAKTNNG